jgi:hypothetical protein
MAKRLIGSGVSYSTMRTYSKAKIYQCTKCNHMYESYENAEVCCD